MRTKTHLTAGHTTNDTSGPRGGGRPRGAHYEVTESVRG